MTKEQRQDLAQAAMARATESSSAVNDAMTISHFTRLGVTDVRPRENVFTFWGWKAIGRRVRKGEHGCKLTTWISERDKETGEHTGRKFPRTAVVFHISQTEEEPQS